MSPLSRPSSTAASEALFSAEEQAQEMSFDIDLDFDLDLVEPVQASPVRIPPIMTPRVMDDVSDPHTRTVPLPMMRTANSLKRRVLVISADADERMYLRARLALAKLTWLVEATTTTQAQAELDKYPYVLVMVNLDDPVIDGIAVVREFHLQHPNIPCVATLSLRPPPALASTKGPNARPDLIRRAVEAGFQMVLDKPMVPKLLADLFASVQKKQQ